MVPKPESFQHVEETYIRRSTRSIPIIVYEVSQHFNLFYYEFFINRTTTRVSFFTAKIESCTLLDVSDTLTVDSVARSVGPSIVLLLQPGGNGHPTVNEVFGP